MTKAYIIGAGIHPFGQHEHMSGLGLGVFAANEALKDANLDWKDMQFACGGSLMSGYADSMVSDLGLTGIQFINVTNGCATGGSALLSAQQAILSGQYDLGLVVGFDKHERGAFNVKPEDWGLPKWYGETGLMLTTQFFGMKIQRYMALHGISEMSLARVAHKAYENGARAPHAWRRQPVDMDTILNSTMVSDPLRKYMFCSPCHGAAALVVASEKKMKALGAKGIGLRAAVMRTRPQGSFEVFAPCLEPQSGKTSVTLAAEAAFAAAGAGPEDMDIAQVQDTESGAEIMHLAENGFCRDGEQEAMLRNGDTRLDGRLPVNTDGGCMACGEPIGASGLRQVYENVIQLRGAAGERQVRNNPRLAYSQVYGAPGVAAAVIVESARTC